MKYIMLGIKRGIKYGRGAVTPSNNLFIPSGSDSLVTSDSLTFNHSGT